MNRVLSSFVIVCLIAHFSMAQNETLDFSKGKNRLFLCEGTPQSKGLKFSLRYPEKWESVTPDRPNIACKIANDSTGSVQIMVMVRKLPQIPDSDELEYLQSREAVLDALLSDFPNSIELIVEDNHKIEGESAVFAFYKTDVKRLDHVFEISSYNYFFIYKDFRIGLSAGVSVSKGKDSKMLYEKYINIFKLIASSFCHTK
ncbi:MAG: hypothetical protein IPJ26_12950 [Bacteroidetes bacterium]|nr:hypothetical protein [Bacteroidota bacterium]